MTLTPLPRLLPQHGSDEDPLKAVTRSEQWTLSQYTHIKQYGYPYENHD